MGECMPTHPALHCGLQGTVNATAAVNAAMALAGAPSRHRASAAAAKSRARAAAVAAVRKFPPEVVAASSAAAAKDCDAMWALWKAMNWWVGLSATAYARLP